MRIEQGDNGLVLHAGLVDLPLSHWQVDTFLADYPEGELREFIAFELDPDGTIGGFSFFGQPFARIE